MEIIKIEISLAVPFALTRVRDKKKKKRAAETVLVTNKRSESKEVMLTKGRSDKTSEETSEEEKDKERKRGQECPGLADKPSGVRAIVSHWRGGWNKGMVGTPV